MSERERFESWARQRWTHPEDFDARIKDPGKYNNYEVQAAWGGVARKGSTERAERAGHLRRHDRGY